MSRSRRPGKSAAEPAKGKTSPPAPSLSASPARPVLNWLAPLLLLIAVVACYHQVASHDFVAWDDDAYVTRNLHVNTGLQKDNIRWAFTSLDNSNWHPLTWLSHQLDVQLYGLWAGGHKITNVALHAVNTLLLLWLLVTMTGDRLRSALVAALFALHPLHVESVAWVSERKDVLSTCFGFAAMLAYVAWVRRGGAGRYLLLLLLFALSLLAKPMFVTLPFLLLLLDLWPLRRRFSSTIILEKLPLLIFTVGSSVVTYIAQQKGSAVVSLESLSLSARLGNAVVSVARYLAKMLWPVDLVFYYPNPATIPARLIAWSAVLVILLTIAAVYAARRRRPEAIVGWLWFLGMLVPVIGLVQVGAQAIADRYTYVPMVGLFIAIIWLIPWPRPAVVAAVAVIALLAVLTFRQVDTWRNSLRLFGHAVYVSPDNYRAHFHFGVALQQANDIAEAEKHFDRSRTLNPKWGYPYKELALIRRDQGDIAGAVKLVREALQYEHRFSAAHYFLAELLESQGDLDGAVEQSRLAIEDNADYHEAWNMLGNLLTQQGRFADAAAAFHRAIDIHDRNADYHYNLARVHLYDGEPLRAIDQLKLAVALDPRHAEALHHLGIAMVRLGRHDEAVGYFSRALALSPDTAAMQANLATALHALRSYDSALDAVGHAVRLQPDFAPWRVQMGRILESMQRFEPATEQYARAVELDPTNSDAHNAYGAMLARQRHFDRAIAHFKEAIRLDPNNSSAQHNLERARTIVERAR